MEFDVTVRHKRTGAVSVLDVTSSQNPADLAQTMARTHPHSQVTSIKRRDKAAPMFEPELKDEAPAKVEPVELLPVAETVEKTG